MHRSKLPLTTWFWAAHLMATHSNGMSARQLEDQLGLTYKTAWLLTQKLRRSMVDPNREPLEGVVEVDQTEIPFRVGDTFFEPGNAGKILIAGAVEVIDRGANQAKPRRKHAKYLDTRSGRVRLAMIADNSATSIEAFVKANVKRATTLLQTATRPIPDWPAIPARSAHGRQDGGPYRPAVDLSGFRANEAVGPGHLSRLSPQARRHISRRIRLSLQSPLTRQSHLKPCSGLPRITNRRAIGISSAETILASVLTHSDMRRVAERRQPECDRTTPRPHRASDEINPSNRHSHYI